MKVSTQLNLLHDSSFPSAHSPFRSPICYSMIYFFFSSLRELLLRWELTYLAKLYIYFESSYSAQSPFHCQIHCSFIICPFTVALESRSYPVNLSMQQNFIPFYLPILFTHDFSQLYAVFCIFCSFSCSIRKSQLCCDHFYLAKLSTYSILSSYSFHSRLLSSICCFPQFCSFFPVA